VYTARTTEERKKIIRLRLHLIFFNINYKKNWYNV
jgi:hypothetical protein